MRAPTVICRVKVALALEVDSANANYAPQATVGALKLIKRYTTELII